MILLLRKNHFRIWVLMALVLIPLFIIGVINVPDENISQFNRILPTPYTLVVKKIENENFTINIRTDQNNNFQIDIFIKNTIAVPSGVFHIVKDNESFSDKTYVGNLLSSGLLRYELETNPVNSKLLLVDYLRKSTLIEINL